jgi:hypothetical protein
MAHHDFLQPPKNKLSHTGLNWSVSRVLGISLVADGSCNGRNPDLSVVALYCLIFGAFQSFTFLPALFGNNAVMSFITGTSSPFSRATIPS